MVGRLLSVREMGGLPSTSNSMKSTTRKSNLVSSKWRIRGKPTFNPPARYPHSHSESTTHGESWELILTPIINNTDFWQSRIFKRCEVIEQEEGLFLSYRKENSIAVKYDLV